MTVDIQGIAKSFGAVAALRGVSLRAARGELIALLGPSGCGKTTLLRILAGLEHADAGTIAFDGADVTDAPARERNVGFVFQSYALFEHMTVFENVAFALRVRRARDADVRERVAELLDRVQLRGLAQRRATELSGGQRQRVAIARALAARPRVLLLDEPFGALDARVRQDVRGWLRRLHDEMQTTTFLVTHDSEDAFEIADRVAVMKEGLIEQVATPADVYESPASAWVMRFLGDVNELSGLPDGEVRYARPHDVTVSREPLDRDDFRARVARIDVGTRRVRIVLSREEGGQLVADVDPRHARRLALKPGDDVHARAEQFRAFPAERHGPERAPGPRGA